MVTLTNLATGNDPEMASAIDAQPRFRAFISYSHRDDRTARWLHRALESYRVPSSLVGQVTEVGPAPRKVSPIFRDEEELAGATVLGAKLETALRDSAALIVVCSPNAAASHWVDREVRFFKQNAPERPVLAVIAHGGELGVEACFPPSLLKHVDAAGEIAGDAAEPFAPDLQRLDRESVKLKLVAGLLGVAYDDLARRDLHRSRRRIAALGTLATVVVTALSVLTLVATNYAKQAVLERNRAKAAEHAAQQSLALAERRAWLANAAAEALRRQAGSPQIVVVDGKTQLTDGRPGCARTPRTALLDPSRVR